MADENKDIETLQDPAVTEAGETHDETEHAEESQATQLPFALGEDDKAGEQGSGATDAPAESDPTSEAPADAEAPGTSDSLTPAAEGSSEAPVADSTTAGDVAATDEAPAATGTPAAADAPNDLSVSDAAAPAVDAPAQDPTTSTSTGIGGDKASEVAPAEEPKLDPAPAPSPAPSSPGLFDHGTPINLPATTVDVSEGYPVAQPDVAPVHPQHFGELINDGVGDDAGKVADAPKYPTDNADAASAGAVDSRPAPKTDSFGDKASEPAEDGSVNAEVPQPVIPPHVEGKLAKLFDMVSSIESSVDQLIHELLD